MFCIDYNGPRGNIIFPTSHSYIGDKNITGICYICGYYISNNNFGQFAITKASATVFSAGEGWYVCNVNGTWVDGIIHLFVR